MATACVDIVCTDACSDNLPAVEFSICAPEINQGEIDAIFVTNVGNPLIDETDAAEWATRMAATRTTWSVAGATSVPCPTASCPS